MQYSEQKQMSDELLCKREKEIKEWFDSEDSKWAAYNFRPYSKTTWDIIFDKLDFKTDQLCTLDVETRGTNHVYNNYRNTQSPFLLRSIPQPTFANHIKCSCSKCCSDHQLFMNKTQQKQLIPQAEYMASLMERVKCDKHPTPHSYDCPIDPRVMEARKPSAGCVYEPRLEYPRW